MKRNVPHAIAAISSMLVVTACAQNGSATKTPIAANEIGVGVAGPMTAQLRAFGAQERDGVEQAIADINASGGVLGKQLRLVSADDQCSDSRAGSVAKDLVAQQVAVVIGHFCSRASIPASQVYGAVGLLQITPASTSPALTEQAAAAGYATVFRVVNRDDQSGTFAGSWIAKHYAGKRLAVVDDGAGYGAEIARAAFAAAEEGGLRPNLHSSFHSGDKDFAGLVEALKAAKIDVVYAGAYHDELAPLVRQARAAGFKGDFIAGDAINTDEFPRLAGDAAEGVRFSDQEIAGERTTAQAAVEKLRSSHRTTDGYALYAYAGVQVFAAAATGTGSTDGRKMAEWLRGHTVPTVLGDLSWDQKGDLKPLLYGWFTWHGGQYSQAPGN